MAISGFVITYNRANLLATCFRSLRFADELVVIDKSSTDGSHQVARRYADRVIRVPWSPTVEETRSLALDACRHPRIAFLDDDEMLSPEAIVHLHALRDAEEPKIVALPLRHWILARFDPNAYYWPEHQVRFFHKNAVSFGPVVHGGIIPHAEIAHLPADSPVYIEHLSHADAAQWIERTNRYTSRPRRVGVAADTSDLIGFAHQRIDHWLAQSSSQDRQGYTAAVALLRAIYDIVDRVKAWEAQGADGASVFAARCAELEGAYDALEARSGIRTGLRGNNRLRRLMARLKAASPAGRNQT